jgi:hypothetical protein
MSLTVCPDAIAQLQARFLELLPRIETHARISFSDVACPQKRADFIAEVVATAWKWFLRLAQRGKNAEDFLVTFCRLLVRAAKSGRKVAGMDKAKDVLNPHAQQRHDFRLESLPRSSRVGHEGLYGVVHGQKLLDAFEDRLRDNTITPIPDQVQFRIDFPTWLQTLTARERRIVRAMGRNERTLDLSKRFRLSPARISQLRREFKHDWDRFCEGIDNAAS